MAVPGDGAPYSEGASADGAHLYVTNESDNSVSAIDIART